MTTIVLTSVSGSPGVTTTAVAMAMYWSNPSILIEAETGRSSSILPGFLRGEVDHSKGLIQFAVAQRHGQLSLQNVWDQSVSIGQDRFLVPGFTSPNVVGSMDGVWGPLSMLLATTEQAGADALVDLGRMGVNDPRMPLVQSADSILLVARPTLPDIAALRVRLPGIQEVLAQNGHLDHLGLLLMDPVAGQAYGAAEISKALGIPVVGSLPWDPRSAGVFSHGQVASAKLDRSPLVRSVKSAVGSVLSASLERRQRLENASGETSGAQL